MNEAILKPGVYGLLTKGGRFSEPGRWNSDFDPHVIDRNNFRYKVVLRLQASLRKQRVRGTVA